MWNDKNFCSKYSNHPLLRASLVTANYHPSPLLEILPHRRPATIVPPRIDIVSRALFSTHVDTNFSGCLPKVRRPFIGPPFLSKWICSTLFFLSLLSLSSSSRVDLYRVSTTRRCDLLAPWKYISYFPLSKFSFRLV